ncbi:50S ribosomal protein L11 [Thermoplasma sp.]|uniref:50S ribosomal protein L11 n=1 Tax=Thermoplasma sp. TaxID=1973142 RepID=UPI00126E15AE|nr:50S ribosomal protein L11 [Thermoplasma sp.]KAA8922810.1 MAG: 50S ribosomal protein L11 [Thermoplasma sp.]
MAQSVKTMVEGGKATTGPPIGPALGPLGLNVAQVVKEINEKTKEFQGMRVPVTITVVDPETKKYEITVGIPPTSALLKKKLGIEKGATKRKEAIAGNATLDQIVEVAKTKMVSMLASDLKAATLEVLGTCVSMGINVDGKDPKEVQRQIKAGEISI